MTDNFETVKVKLVTIIASFELGNRIATELRALGVGGYTKTKADGWGNHGLREYGIIDGANVRFDSVVTPEVATKILRAIAVSFSNQSILAFAQDVEALPNRQFEATQSSSEP